MATMTKRPNRTKQLPPDPDAMNTDRTRWADAALIEFQRLTRADTEDAVSDLLTDLIHRCDRHGQHFDAELGRARNHYEFETNF